MKLEQAIEILKDHNAWRRGSGLIPYPESPHLIGEAMDVAVDAMTLLEDVICDIAVAAKNPKYWTVQMSPSTVEDVQRWNIHHG